MSEQDVPGFTYSQCPAGSHATALSGLWSVAPKGQTSSWCWEIYVYSVPNLTSAILTSLFWQSLGDKKCCGESYRDREKGKEERKQKMRENADRLKDRWIDRQTDRQSLRRKTKPGWGKRGILSEKKRDCSRVKET